MLFSKTSMSQGQRDNWITGLTDHDEVDGTSDGLVGGNEEDVASASFLDPNYFANNKAAAFNLGPLVQNQSPTPDAFNSEQVHS